MLRTKVDAQPCLWETFLPPEVNAMPPGLQGIDRLLDDPVFFEPFVPHFDPEIGRPTIPMETYLRMMFLRFRYRLGFETLCKEVADSLGWRRFCRIGITDPVPHPTTLLKITTRCGEGAVAGLNQALVEKAVAEKLIKLDKVRADTTVVQANVACPTDSSLLAKGVAKLARTVTAIKALGLAPRTRFRNRTRSVRRRAHDIGAWLRRRSGDAKDEVLSLTAEVARIAQHSVIDAQAVLTNARRAIRQGHNATGRAKALISELERTISIVDRLVAQARSRIDGEKPDGATRVVSLHDTDARPIRKGRLDRPVEFGYKAQIVDNAQGVVLDHQVTMGNPPDAPMLVPAIKRVINLVGRIPRAIAADRGYGEASVDDQLQELGVKTVAIPRKGRPGTKRQEVERTRPFRRLVKWRTAAEGRISHLKHAWGMERTMLDGITGTHIWCGWGVLAHNAVKIADLSGECDRQRAARATPTGDASTPRPPPTHPPPDDQSSV